MGVYHKKCNSVIQTASAPAARVLLLKQSVNQSPVEESDIYWFHWHLHETFQPVTGTLASLKYKYNPTLNSSTIFPFLLVLKIAWIGGGDIDPN